MRSSVRVVAALLLILGVACASRTSNNVCVEEDYKFKDIKIKGIRILPVNPNVAIGKSIELMAIGINSLGLEQSISPNWKIIEGARAGSLGSTAGTKVTYMAKAIGSSTVAAELAGVRSQVVVNVKQSISVKGRAK